MSYAAAAINAMVERVTAVAVPAGFGGSFYPKFDAWLFADSGAETRIFLRAVEDRLVVTRAARGNTTEYLEFSTPLLNDMEKFLTYFFSRGLREVMRLPRLLVVPIPVTIDKAAPGFTIAHPDSPWWE